MQLLVRPEPPTAVRKRRARMKLLVRPEVRKRRARMKLLVRPEVRKRRARMKLLVRPEPPTAAHTPERTGLMVASTTRRL
jgi:hypothetical protein